jgi:hypothetical protein
LTGLREKVREQDSERARKRERRKRKRRQTLEAGYQDTVLTTGVRLLETTAVY